MRSIILVVELGKSFDGQFARRFGVTKLHGFKEYEITRKLGFLAHYDAAAVDLPDELQDVVITALALPELIVTGEVQKHLDAMRHVDLTDFCDTASDAQIRMAMVHYTFMLQSYIWGSEKVHSRLPKCIAEPTWKLSRRTGQPPILTYSNYVLDNWCKIDPNGQVDLSNIRMIQPFLGGQDEAWFVLIHVAIEAAAGEVLNQIPAVISGANALDHERVYSGLLNINSAWHEINHIFARMPERCDPYVYFHRVRPWINGFKDNPALPHGVIYEGVDEYAGQGQLLRGQTGSQSSIVPTMDALLKVNHAADPLRAYLDELHIYRPPSHRRFIEDVHASSNLRQMIVDSNEPRLKVAYNDCLEGLAAFRTKHLEYAASYINKQGKGGAGNSSEVGTGGTPFMRYLKKHRDEVNKNLL